MAHRLKIRLNKKQSVIALICLATIVFLTSSVAAYAMYKNNLQSALAVQKLNDTSSVETDNKQAETLESEVVTTETAQTTEPAAATTDTQSSTTPKAGQPKVSVQPSQPAYTPPASDMPFAVSGVTLNGAQYFCSGGGVVTQISTVTIQASNPKGGSFTWQIEVMGNWEDRGAPYPTTQAFSPNQIYVTLGSWMNPGVFYSSTHVRDGESVRVHVTAPNDIASAWFTVPAGTMQSCA